MLDKYIKLDGVVAGPLGRNTNRYASNGSLRIAYELQGLMHRRRPWLVLIQGMGFDRSGWDPVLSALRRRFRLVLVDNRGTGRSDRPDGSFNVADMADDVVAVLDAAGIGRAHVLGASPGGMVAQELAIIWPERVGRLPGVNVVTYARAVRGGESTHRSVPAALACWPAAWRTISRPRR